jgi:hypothetical protein
MNTRHTTKGNGAKQQMEITSHDSYFGKVRIAVRFDNLLLYEAIFPASRVDTPEKEKALMRSIGEGINRVMALYDKAKLMEHLEILTAQLN